LASTGGSVLARAEGFPNEGVASVELLMREETIRGHVFCSFLALLLRKELEDRLARKEWKLE
jgi:hypothetical protein